MENIVMAATGVAGNLCGASMVAASEAYWNPAVVARFARDYKKTPEESAKCFEELKEFLSIAAATGAPIEPPSRDVDQMWHTFLLFTRDYADFCRRFFGKFVHHVPRSGNAKGAADCTCNQCDGDGR